MRHHPITQQDRDSRRERAIATANNRTPQEQLAHLDKMGMVAKKERAKIAKKLQNSKKSD